MMFVFVGFYQQQCDLQLMSFRTIGIWFVVELIINPVQQGVVFLFGLDWF